MNYLFQFYRRLSGGFSTKNKSMITGSVVLIEEGNDTYRMSYIVEFSKSFCELLSTSLNFDLGPVSRKNEVIMNFRLIIP